MNRQEVLVKFTGLSIYYEQFHYAACATAWRIKILRIDACYRVACLKEVIHATQDKHE